MIKWFGAILGYMYGRFPGAIIGFIIGSIIERFMRSKSSSGGFQHVFQQQQRRVSLGDFELNLLSLASLVIKSDGKANHEELNYVRSYFVRAYGKEKANATFRTFNTAIKNREISAQKICSFLIMRTRYAVRLQIIHFLFAIAQADGSVSSAELNKIVEIANYLRISPQDFESIKAMFFKSADNAYKILEVEKDASDTEIKKAYREMVKKYHPDKLQHMDETHQRGAREKFNKVQEAYEKIQKERGFRS